MRLVTITIDYETEVTYNVDVEYAEDLLYTSKESYETSLNEQLGEFLYNEDGTQVENVFKFKNPIDVIEKIVGEKAMDVVMNCEHDYLVSKPLGNLFKISCVISFDVIPGAHDLYLNETKLTGNAIDCLYEYFCDWLYDWENDVVLHEWEGIECNTNLNHKCKLIDLKCEVKTM